VKTINLPADTRHLFLDEIAHLIADYNDPEGPNDPDGVKYELGKIQATNEVHQAAINGQLPVRHPGGGPFQLGLGLQRAVVLLPHVVVYLAEYGITAVIDSAPAQEAPTPKPVESAKAGPVPVTTRAMADSFAGLHWNADQWIKKLGDKPVWLDACMVLNRGRGEGQRLWNPVLIGSYLVRMGHVKAKSVRAKFQTQPALTPWLDEWKTYEADNHPTD
jgi:hypothetical protein